MLAVVSSVMLHAIKRRLTAYARKIMHLLKKICEALNGGAYSAMSTTRNKGRADTQTVLGVSMPKELKDRIKRAAAIENRTMANWCVHHLDRIVRELESRDSKTSASQTFSRTESVAMNEQDTQYRCANDR